MWKVTLTNSSQTPIRVYLYGTATSTKDGKIVDATTSVFTLNPGVKMVQANEVGPIDVNKQNNQYDEIIRKIGGPPSGFYQICVTAKKQGTNEILGYDCIDQEVQNFTEVELLSPMANTLFTDMYFDSKDFKDTSKATQRFLKMFDRFTINKIRNAENTVIGNGQFISFTWLPPTPVPRGYNIRYMFKVVEVFARQSAYDAMQSNPMYYSNSAVTVPYLQYPLSAKQFKSGGSYAWQVYAYVNNVLVSKSEIWGFTYVNTSGQMKKNMGVGKYSGSLDNYSRYDNEYDRILNYSEKDYKEYVLKEMINERKGAGLSSISPEAGNKIFLFSGSTRGLAENNGIKTTGSDMPKSFANLELAPQLSIYGVPFSTSIFISTLANQNKQELNSFALFFDLNYLKQKLNERVEFEKRKIEDKISEEKQKLEKRLLDEKDKLEKKVYDEKEKIERKLIGDKEAKLKEAVGDGSSLLSGPMKFFSYFKTLGVGVSYPEYSKYSLSGVPVTGLDIEFNPGLFYVAFAGLRNQREVQDEAFKRNLYSGRLGVGKIDKSHFILTMLYVKDDQNSMIPSESVSNFINPKANYLFGALGKLTLFDNMISVEAESNASLYTRDVRDAALGEGDVPKFLVDMFHPTISSSVDYMYAVNTIFNNEKSNTKVSFGLSMIGPGYLSLGAPTVRNDKFGIDTKVEQKFADRKISVTAGFKTSSDNLIVTKLSKTTISSGMLNVGMNFRGYPFLRLSYMPYFQKNDNEAPESKVDNKTHIFSANTGYNANLGKNVMSQTSLLFSLQDTRTYLNMYDSKNMNLMLMQSVSFEDPVTLSGSLGYVNSSFVGIEDSKIITSDFSFSHTSFNAWQNSVGFMYSWEADRNSKFGLFFNSTATIWQRLNIDFRAEYSSYREQIFNPNNYNDNLVRLTVGTNW
jgi:hypothetical protein